MSARKRRVQAAAHSRVYQKAWEYWKATAALATRHAAYLGDAVAAAPHIEDVLTAYVQGAFMKPRRLFDVDPDARAVSTVDPWVQLLENVRVRPYLWRHAAVPAASALMALCDLVLRAPRAAIGVSVYRGERRAAAPSVGDLRTLLLPFSASWASPFAETFPVFEEEDACCLDVIRLRPGTPMLALQGPRGLADTTRYSTIAYEVLLPPCVLRVVSVERRASVPTTHALAWKQSAAAEMMNPRVSVQKTMVVVTYEVAEVLGMPKVVGVSAAAAPKDYSAQLPKGTPRAGATLHRPLVQVTMQYQDAPRLAGDRSADLHAIVQAVPPAPIVRDEYWDDDSDDDEEGGATSAATEQFAVVVIADVDGTAFPLRTMTVVQDRAAADALCARWRQHLVFPGDPYSWALPDDVLLPGFDMDAARVYTVARNWPLGINGPGSTFDWEAWHNGGDLSTTRRGVDAASMHRGIAAKEVAQIDRGGVDVLASWESGVEPRLNSRWATWWPLGAWRACDGAADDAS